MNLFFNFVATLPDDSTSTAASCYIWNATQQITLENMGHAKVRLFYTERTCSIYGKLSVKCREGID